ncbi:MAG TPA: alkaline phosphatase family protein, partial [Chitinophagaceae bacterium]|nr:alkaline phosphatase family protein [Chitinophagaceae bacterium]
DTSRRKIQAAIGKKQEVLDRAGKEIVAWSRENFDKLSPKARDLYRRAFTINDQDPDFHDLATLSYKDGGVDRELPVPKGDVLRQFREDVSTGNLPTVSWLCSAQNFSDHPSAPWYGSLYVSEVMDILTKDPEVWRKTIFIVTFDENDGYFDHVPPFVAPDPLHPETGKCSKGIDTDVEYIRLENELKEGIPKRAARGGPIGLGFRVPMLIASPWSRGGQVCSEVVDHTSILQFMEGFMEKKWGKNIREENISKWRRTITGDLTAVFKAYQGTAEEKLPFLKKDPFIEKIYNAKFKETPSDFKPLTDAEIAVINRDPSSSTLMPRQETGIRPSTPLPYQLYGEGKLSGDKRSFEINLSASDAVFGKGAAGAPFNVYIPVKYRAGGKAAGGQDLFTSVGSRSYAVTAGDRLTDVWPVADFEHGIYHLQVYGPNGWFREFRGTKDDPDIAVLCDYEYRKGLLRKLSGNIELKVKNLDPGQSYQLTVTDNAYGNGRIQKTLEHAGAKAERSIILDLAKHFCWYDFTIHIAGFDHFERRYAGRVETGKSGFTDPVMGRV